MSAPTTLVWDLAGRPDPVPNVAALLADVPDVCALSGDHEARTAPLAKALGANFTDQSLYRAHSDRVGAGALWCCSGKPPATLRMWSIVAAPGVDLPPSHEKAWIHGATGLHLTNRAATGAIIDTLIAPPDGEWMVTVAVSGQKHVVPYGTVNRGPGAWVVRMETTNVAGDPGQWALVLATAARLRAAGHRADDVRAGSPTMAALKTADDINAWRALADRLAPYTRSPLLDLALWCLTKEQIHARA